MINMRTSYSKSGFLILKLSLLLIDELKSDVSAFQRRLLRVGCLPVIPPYPSLAPRTPSVKSTTLLNLLFWSQLVGVTALLLPAVGSSRWQTGVAFSADHLITVVFAGKGFEGGFDNAAAETEDEMQCGFLGRQIYVSISGKFSFTFLQPCSRVKEEIVVRGAPSGYCSLIVCGHLRVAFRQKSSAAGRVGCLPYFEFWT